MKKQTRLTMTGNQKSIGVPAPIHAKATKLANRDGLKLWELIAEALVVYDRMYSPRIPINGSDQDAQ